jgi:hypothetical protein
MVVYLRMMGIVPGKQQIAGRDSLQPTADSRQKAVLSAVDLRLSLLDILGERQ